MKDILEEAPTITEFCIHIIYTANTIDFLSWFSADNAGVSPNLRTISLAFSSISPLNIRNMVAATKDLLVAMESRWRTGKLREVHLFFPLVLSLRVSKWRQVEELKSKGLHISISALEVDTEDLWIPKPLQLKFQYAP
jgi:hypothetical protein